MSIAPSSIRGKITAGYVLSFFFLLFVATVLFVSLVVVESRVAFYSGISRFLDTTLEMRRYEKNYLLYDRKEDLDAALQYAEAARELLAGDGIGERGGSRHPGWMRLLAGQYPEAEAPGRTPERTEKLLHDYVALLRRAVEERSGGSDVERKAVELAVRETGRTITETAERLSSAEGRNIQEMLRAGRRTLVLLVVLFLLGTTFMARVVYYTAIQPLRELEHGMRRIAAGDYVLFAEEAGDGEIASMHRAFNRMIHEIFEHRAERLQSEKLASLGTMLAGIAHEINNPLSNVSTSAEILAEENERASPEERRELVEQIISQTDRATDIIRTILDFTREGRFELRTTNLLSAVRGAVILVRGQMPAHVSVGLDVPPELEIVADKAKLQQAFINILSNSIDALRQVGREGRIAISARNARGGVEIAFADDGAGIPAHLVDRIFDPFFTTKDVGHGTGLGLYVTHQIVEQHGGTIRVESGLGEGTRIILALPRRELPAPGPGEHVPNGEASRA